MILFAIKNTENHRKNRSIKISCVSVTSVAKKIQAHRQFEYSAIDGKFGDKMKQYDFDNPNLIRDYFSLHNYHWVENAAGERSLEYVTGTLLRGIGFSGILAGVFWFAFGYFLPIESNWKIGITIGGCLFCVGGFVAGWLIERYIHTRGPLLILKPDKTIVLHRLRQTVVPDASTHFELINPTKQHLDHFDLVLWHQNHTYYVASGGISMFGGEPKTPLEKLYAELCEIYPFAGKETESRKEAHDQAVERKREQGQKLALFVTFMLGSTFTLVGGALLWKYLSTEKQSELATILAGSAFLVAGIITLAVFMVLLVRTIGYKDNKR